MKYVLLILFSFSISALSFAQTDSSIVPLSEVVVTGQYKPQSVKNSVYQVRVITARQIKMAAPAKLQDVLSTQLNIRFSQDNATGGSNINMLGLSGQNVKILVDGVPMFGRQGISNEININQIDVNSIERIEIIEGPMSVIYGADALAGVINIITKKRTSLPYSISAGVQEESAGKEYGLKQGSHNQFISLRATKNHWYAGAGFNHNMFNGWKDTATGRELSWHKKQQISGNAFLGYQTPKLNVYYRLDGLHETITNPANLPLGGEPALDQDYISNRLMHQFQATYSFQPKLILNSSFSYTHYTREVYSTLYYPNGDVRLATAPGLQSFSTLNGYTARASVVYQPIKKITFQPGIDINIESGDGERIKAGNHQINDYAFFLTSEIAPVKWINIKPGVRFIHNSVYKASPVIPSLNIKAAPTDKLTVRLAYARGFRSPSMRELYFDFFDASHSITGNPNLEAELSNSITASVDYLFINKPDVSWKSSLNGFYNDVTNMIDYASIPGSTVITYMNVDKYKTRGFTLINELTYHQLKINIGAGYTARFNQYSESDSTVPSFRWSPEINSNISYNFKKAGLSINLFYKYTGKLPSYLESVSGGGHGVAVAETGDYHWADISISKKLFNVLRLHAGIRNLFNVKSVESESNDGTTVVKTYLPLATGRGFFAGLTFDFPTTHNNQR